MNLNADAGSQAGAEVTYVVPSMGRETLPIAVESALGQTVPCRVIVVDSGGRSVELPPRLRDLVTVVSTGRPLQPGAARQLGFEAAQTSYVGFLDDDDILLPHKTSAQLALIWDGGLEVATSNFFLLSYAETLAWPTRPVGSVEVQPPRPPQPGEDIRAYLFHRRSLRARRRLVTSSILVQREAAARTRWPEGQARYEDWAWLTALANAGVRWGHHQDALVGITLAAPSSISVNKESPAAGDYAWAFDSLGGDRRALGDFLACDVALACLKAGDLEHSHAVYRRAVAAAEPSRIARLRYRLEYHPTLIAQKRKRSR